VEQIIKTSNADTDSIILESDLNCGIFVCQFPVYNNFLDVEMLFEIQISSDWESIDIL
jgi:hypothetical protein